MVTSRAKLGHDKVHKMQSVKRNFMFARLQKVTLRRKRIGVNFGIEGIDHKSPREFST
jgi:hypothetical protein